MDEHSGGNELQKLIMLAKAMRTLVLFCALLLAIILLMPEAFHSYFKTENVVAETAIPSLEDEVVDGLHISSGLIADTGYEKIIAQCSGCHSLKLVTQNRASREGWKSIIEWMQETQNLWDLGPDEEAILTYLAKNYAPEKKGRRQNLENISWYELEN